MPFIILFLLIIVLVLVGIFIGNYYYNQGIKRKKTELKLESPEDVYLQNNDGLILHSAVIRKNTEDWVILCHGYGSNWEYVYSRGKEFSQKGFSVLMPDARGHGESQGKYIGLGWHDRLDLVEWIDFINEHNAPRRIILMGVSMGAAEVLMAGGLKLTSNVQCIISDSSFSSIKESLKYQLREKYNIHPYPSLLFASIVCKHRAQYSLIRNGNCVKELEKCRLPIMFIHSNKDTTVPVEMAHELYKKYKGTKKLYILEQAKHGRGNEESPKEYWGEIYKFVKENSYFE